MTYTYMLVALFLNNGDVVTQPHKSSADCREVEEILRKNNPKVRTKCSFLIDDISIHRLPRLKLGDLVTQYDGTIYGKKGFVASITETTSANLPVISAHGADMHRNNSELYGVLWEDATFGHYVRNNLMVRNK